jgi:type III secretion protein V
VENPTAIVLSECLRSSMRRQLCHRIAGENGILGLVMVDPSLEETARRGLLEMSRQNEPDNASDSLTFAPETATAVVARFSQLARQQLDECQEIAVVVSADLRRRLRNFLAANEVHLPVLSPHEVAAEVPTLPLELVSLGINPAAAVTDGRTPVRGGRAKVVGARAVALG